MTDSERTDAEQTPDEGGGPPGGGGLPLDPVQACFAAQLDEIIANRRAMGALQAREVALLDALQRYSETEVVASLVGGGTGRADARGSGPEVWSAEEVARHELVFELSAALRIPERTVEGMLEEARALTDHLPATLAALGSGDLSYRHAAVMLDQALSLPEEARAAFEQALLPDAVELTVGKFARRARQRRERLHPVSITERHSAAVAERRVWVELLEDGMADLTARLSAEVALAAYDRLTRIAGEKQSPDDPRNLGARRADAVADLLLSGDTCDAAAAGEPALSVLAGGGAVDAAAAATSPAGIGHGIRAEVAVTVPVLTLLGHSEEAGELAGYGPIDPDTARRLTADVPSFARVLVHPVTSAILDVDRERYRIPADLRTALRLRDGTCRTTNCNTSARHSDIDHVQPWAEGGTTQIGNLAHECPRHHVAKHNSRVRMRALDDGEIEITTPSGKVYVTRPDNPFQRGASSAGPGRPWPGTGRPSADARETDGPGEESMPF